MHHGSASHTHTHTHTLYRVRAMYSKPSVQTDESELKHRAVMIINVWRCCCLTGVSSAALEPGEKTSLRHHCGETHTHYSSYQALTHTHTHTHIHTLTLQLLSSSHTHTHTHTHTHITAHINLTHNKPLPKSSTAFKISQTLLKTKHLCHDITVWGILYVTLEHKTSHKYILF